MSTTRIRTMPLSTLNPVEEGLRDIVGALVPPDLPVAIDLSAFPRLPLMLELMLLRIVYEVTDAAVRHARPRALRVQGWRDGARAVLAVDAEEIRAAAVGLPSLHALHRSLEAVGGTLTWRRGASLQACLRLPA